jgi:HTH-type transcriptional regulator/antitoxin HipB
MTVDTERTHCYIATDRLHDDMAPIHSIHDVSVAARGRRLDLGLTQTELARRARVSRKWIYEFEKGKTTAEFGLVLRVLEQLDLKLELTSKEVKAPNTSVTLDQILAQMERDAGRNRG